MTYRCHRKSGKSAY